MVLILIVAIVTGHRPIRAWSRVAGPAVVAGFAGAGATLLFLGATGTAQLAVAAVITSLYPAVTVILARVLLGERWSRPQVVGLLASVVGVALISLS